MQKQSTVEIAQKRRHLHLLTKIKQNKPLTAAELRELKEYEQLMAKNSSPINQKIQNRTGAAGGAKKKPVKKPKARRAKKAAKQSKTRKRTQAAKVRNRTGAAAKEKIRTGAVRVAAIECSSVAEAEDMLGLTDLAGRLVKDKKIAAAWNRGRLLRNIAEFAATAATIDEANESLGMAKDELTDLLAVDAEVADTWNQARLRVTLDLKRALVTAAKEGKPSAIKNVERILRREIAKEGIDASRVTIPEMCEITGKTRQTIHDWHTKHSCPRNSDKTFNLTSFLKWFEEFCSMKVGGRLPAANSDPFKTAKTEKIEIELARHRGQLLDRGEVIAGLIARLQNLVNALERKPEELAIVLHGQPTESIVKILTEAFAEIRRQQLNVPEVLRLTPKAEKMLTELLTEVSGKVKS